MTEMALVVCPECQNNISEYAEACPQCGCPMSIIKRSYSNEICENCVIDGVKFNLSGAKELIINNKLMDGVHIIEDITNLNFENAKDLGMAIKISGEIPKVYPMNISEAPTQSVYSIKECPICYKTYSNNIIYCKECCVELKTKSKIKRYGIMNTSYKVINSNEHAPKCPTCGSLDVGNIGGLERGASILTLGIFSKKINKSFKCNNCGYLW